MHSESLLQRKLQFWSAVWTNPESESAHYRRGLRSNWYIWCHWTLYFGLFCNGCWASSLVRYVGQSTTTNCTMAHTSGITWKISYIDESCDAKETVGSSILVMLYLPVFNMLNYILHCDKFFTSSSVVIKSNSFIDSYLTLSGNQYHFSVHFWISSWFSSVKLMHLM